MTKRLLVLMLLLFTARCASAQIPSTCVPGTNIYYISSGIGLDSRTQAQARSKSTPWAHAPGMLNFTGTYSHTAGDCFVFRGGDSWSAASFQMNVTHGGSSSSLMDYYGVDLTWFTGGSFTRPQFALANTAPSTNGGLSGSRNVVNVNSPFTEWDNIEEVGMFIVGGHGEGASGYDCGIYFKSGSTNNLVVNVFFHDWVSSTTDIVNGWSNCAGGLGQNGGSYVVRNSIFSGQNSMDLTRGVQVSFGGCFQNSSGASGNHCSYVGQGAVNFFGEGIHDNEFDHISDAGTALSNCTGPYAGQCSTIPPNGIHTNGIQSLGGSAGVPIYNNAIHDSPSVGVTILACSSANVFNNVMWAVALPAIRIDTGTGFCPGPATNTANVYNNTVECDTGGCVQVNNKTPTLGTLNVKNNHWIINSPPPVPAICVNGACGGSAAVTNLNSSNNLSITPTQATTNGYTVATKFKAFPAAGPTSTVKFAANLTAISTGVLAPLGLDTECAPWSGLTCVPRPTGSTAWDAGAYQSPGSGGGTPPTVSAAVSGTGCPSACAGQVTITVTASGGTISSVQPLLDSNTFGNACTSSPCSALWDTTKSGNGAHTVGGTATNGTGQGTATPVSVTVNNTAPGCSTSSAVWQSTSFTTQTGAFTAGGSPMTITPNGIPAVGTGGPVFALSQNPMAAFTDGAALVRQSDNGFWEAYNSAISGYSHTGSASWIVGTPMTPLLTVDTVGQTYSVQVTQNGVTTTIATGYTFRQPATSLSYWNLSPTTPTLTVCNFSLSAATGALTPTSFNFGTLQVGTTASQVFTLTNNGGSPLTVSAYAVSPSVFSITANSCSSPIAAGANCPITVQFAPTAGSPYSGTLHLTTTGTINDSTLTGTGSSISVPGAPTNLAAVASGTSISLTWTGSLGTPPITYNVSRGTVSGGPYTSIATGLAATNYTDPGLANGTYYYVVSGTNPAGTGVNSTQASASISTSPQVNLSPASLSFGNVQLGGSGSLNLTISNVGNASLVFNTPAISPISGANAADFSFGSGCPDGSTVTAGSSCSFLVTFTPSATGTLEQGVLCASSNSPSNPDCVTLSGTGVAAAVVSPTSLSFGNIFVSKTSASQTVTFTNNSGATVTFSSIALTTGTQFAIGTNTCGASVANNTACTVAITFTPTSVGNKSDTLTFTDSAAGSPHTVTMSGNGKKHGILKVGAGI